MTSTATPSTERPPAARTRTHPDTNPGTAARIAGVGYVILFALGIFANFFVREGLIVSDDAQATAANIADSEGLFRLGMVAFLTIFLLDVVVAWALYIVFRNADHDLSLLTAWFRLVYTVFLGAALIYFSQALQLLDGAASLTAIGTRQREAQALLALETFNSAWLIGLAAFGLHVILLGGLVLRSRYAPKALAYVLIAAGAAYVLDTTAHTLLTNYTDYETLFITGVAVPAVIAEGWFGLWLLFRAGKRSG
ncbi:MAG: DUF4386 domain-containing protein [Ornithinimicrobium sp.]